MIRITQTIPELLTSMSKSGLARQLMVSRNTVTKYADDRAGTKYIIVNGRLMVTVAGRRGGER